jgi:hypothetical protein
MAQVPGGSLIATFLSVARNAKMKRLNSNIERSVMALGENGVGLNRRGFLRLGAAGAIGTLSLWKDGSAEAAEHLAHPG